MSCRPSDRTSRTNSTASRSISTGGHTLVTGDDYTRALIPDSGPATLPQNLMATTQTVLPGPDPQHLWIWTYDTGPDNQQPTLRQIDWQAHPTATTIPLPRYVDTRYSPIPDGAGYALYAASAASTTPDQRHETRHTRHVWSLPDPPDS